jgi:hypothetical protein
MLWMWLTSPARLNMTEQPRISAANQRRLPHVRHDDAHITPGAGEVVPIRAAARHFGVHHGDAGARPCQPQSQVTANETQPSGDQTLEFLYAETTLSAGKPNRSMNYL